MGFFDDLVKIAFPLILSAVESIADSQVDGASLSSEQKGWLYSGYVLINVNFDKIVESTDNEYDDQTLQSLSDFAADTLQEGGITVPFIPPELQSL